MVSIHALLAESDCLVIIDYDRAIVSIHALLAESDACHAFTGGSGASFNPRPPCGERRKASDTAASFFWFQSTPSLRRATRWPDMLTSLTKFQSTPSLRRATEHETALDWEGPVSIHALLAESDQRCMYLSPLETVSIHALLAESDLRYDTLKRCPPRFNPRPPCGERLPQRYMLLINHASGALRQLHEDGTSHTVFSSSYLVVNLRFPMSYKNRRLPGNLM